jgi:Tfp pilus assembly PilM family ATPase
MSLFSRVFNFKEHAVGLDISHGRMVAAHFVQDGATVLERLAVAEYDPELPDNELARKIRAFWKKEKLPSRTVCTCLHSRALALRPFSYKNLTREDLPHALMLEAEEALQKKPEEIAMDWHLAPAGPDKETGRRTDLFGLLAAAPRQTVQRHLDLIKAAGLYSISVEPGCSAAYRCYAFLQQKPEPVCLINLAARTADIVVCSNGNCYPRTLFSEDDGWEGNQDYLTGNIQDALLHYELKGRHAPIRQIVLTGSLPDPSGLMARLQKTTSLPVGILNVFNGLEKTARQRDVPGELPPEYSLTTALGLGLRRPLYGHG